VTSPFSVRRFAEREIEVVETTPFLLRGGPERIASPEDVLNNWSVE
jgi:hypothetical protein